MSSSIRLKDSAPVPATPASGYTELFVDPSDSHVKVKDDTGTIFDLQTASAAINVLTGDVTATGPGTVAATVANVGGQTAANVAAGAVLANAATALNTPSALVKRDGSGNFAAGVITASLTGNVTGNVSGSAASITGTNPVANGGTNSSAALSNNRVMQSAGGAIVEAPAITASRALVSDVNGIPTHAATTSAELGHLSGVTSAIQTQLNGKKADFATLPETQGGTNQATYATGDTLHATAANTLSKLAIGTAGQAKKVSSAGITAWEDTTDIGRELILHDDFYGATVFSLGWQSHAGGAGAGTSGASAGVTAAHPGVARMITGSTATGRGGLGLSPSSSAMINGHILDSAPIVNEWVVNVPALSTGAEEFVVTFGSYSHSTVDAQPNGTYFQYDRAGAGVNWQCRTANASTVTTTDSGVAVGAGTWVKMKIVATSSSVTFYIDDVLVATNTTNIPSAVICPSFKIQKTVGTGNSSFDVDAFRLFKRFGTAR